MKKAKQQVREFRLRPVSRAITIACGAMMLTPIAWSQDRAEGEQMMLEEVIVTAQKRDQNLQDVPISMTVLTEAELTKLNVQGFQDYVQYLPSVSFVQLNPSRSEIYIRGISSGGNSELGGASSVAVYLDEQPVTLASTYLNPHIYDVARIEVLAGPQGTLFGANAQSGAIRFITNKPDPSQFAAGYDLELNSVHSGDVGYVAEGFVNIPVAEDRAAVRLVAYYEDDAGYIDNVPTTHTFSNANIRAGLTDPALIAIAQDITVDNADIVEENFNQATILGGRASFLFNLSDNWTTVASVMRQKLETEGVWDHDPINVGDLEVGRLLPESEDDAWTQYALTVQGEIGNYTLTYAGAYLDRQYDQNLDYSLYSDYYLSGSYIPGYYSCYVSYFGYCVDPRDLVTGDEHTKRWTHELRLASDPEKPLRWLVGVFYENSKWISDLEFHVLGLAEFSQFDASGKPIPGASAAIDAPDIYWTTDQDKYVDETAFFGQLEYDFTEKLTGSVSARTFDYNTHLFGFAGTIWWPHCCYQRPDSNIDLKTNDKDTVWRFNLSYSITDEVMVYTTYSEGYRPGGLNRAYSGPIPPAYDADFLDSIEVGTKTTLMDGRLRLNGAIYFQNWNDFQLSRLDLDIAPITLTANIGNAQSNGFEADFNFQASEAWEFSGGISYNKAELTEDYWIKASDEGSKPPNVPKGTPLPRVPELRFNVVSRYNFTLADRASYVQATTSYTGSSYSQFIDTTKETRQKQASYNIANLAWGFTEDEWEAEIYVSNVFDKRAEIYKNSETWDSRITTNRPRTIGLRWRQRF